MESLAEGFQGGYNWLLDHDETAGTVAITVTDAGSPQPGQLMLNGEVWSGDGKTLVDTIVPIRIDPFNNQGRHILLTNAALVGVVLDVPKGQTPPLRVRAWTTFSPA